MPLEQSMQCLSGWIAERLLLRHFNTVNVDATGDALVQRMAPTSCIAPRTDREEPAYSHSFRITAETRLLSNFEPHQWLPIPLPGLGAVRWSDAI